MGVQRNCVDIGPTPLCESSSPDGPGGTDAFSARNARRQNREWRNYSVHIHLPEIHDKCHQGGVFQTTRKLYAPQTWGETTNSWEQFGLVGGTGFEPVTPAV